MARIIHWIAVASVISLLVLDHLPERTPELLMAAWSGTPSATSDWDNLPIMYD